MIPKIERLKNICPSVKDISIGQHLIFFREGTGIDSAQLRQLADVLQDKDLISTSTVKEVLKQLLNEKEREG